MLVGSETVRHSETAQREKKEEEIGTRPEIQNVKCEQEWKEEGGWFVKEGEEQEEEHQACVHNEQDELKGEQREMRGIQKCSQRGKREVGVCTCV